MILAKIVDPIADPQSIPWIVLALGFMAFVTVRAIILEGGLYLFVTRSKFAQARKFLRMPFMREQLKSEIKASLIAIVVDGLFIGTLAHYVPPTPASQGVILSVVVSAIWFEIWFYISHRMLHSKALYFIHRQHHVAVVTGPFTALSFSVIERLILLSGTFGGILVIGLVYPLATFGVAIYLFLNYLLNLFAHSNVEVIPPALVKWKLTNWLNAPTFHALHHARYRGHYGLYTPFLDTIFKSRFEDYEAVHRLAYEGKGFATVAQAQKIRAAVPSSTEPSPGSLNPTVQIV